MNIATVFQAVCDLVGQPVSVTATGGFSQSPVWRQMLADVLDCPVNIPQSFESGCLGAITMAMKSLGLIDDLSAVLNFIGPKDFYQPHAATAATYHRYMPLFQSLEKALTPAYNEIAQLQQN